MKKVKEILGPEKSLFTAFKEKYPDLYYELFEDAAPLDMDGDILVVCGEKYAAPLISYHTADFAVDWLLRRFKDNWLKVKDALTREYDLLKPLTNTTVVTQDLEGTKEDSGTSEQADTKHTVDSPAGVPTDGTKSTDTGKQDTRQHGVTVTEYSGNTGQYSTQSLILNELEVRKQSFVDIVIKDISNNITLDIY